MANQYSKRDPDGRFWYRDSLMSNGRILPCPFEGCDRLFEQRPRWEMRNVNLVDHLFIDHNVRTFEAIAKLEDEMGICRVNFPT